jgi:hypothetical protein
MLFSQLYENLLKNLLRIVLLKVILVHCKKVKKTLTAFQIRWFISSTTWLSLAAAIFPHHWEKTRMTPKMNVIPSK